MNTRRDPDRLIHAFMLEGAEQLDDQVYDAVRGEIDKKRQRVVIGPWRIPALNKLVPIGLGATALVVAVVVGARFLGPPAPGGVGGAPSTSPSPTAAPSVAAPLPSTAAGLPVGPFVVVDTGALPGGATITVTIPSPGWSSLPEFGGLQKGEEIENVPEAAMLLWANPAGMEYDVYGDPCQWTSTRPDTPIATVDEFAAALAGQASRDATVPVDVSVGGYAGKSITLHVPDDAVFADCDQGEFASYGFEGDSRPSRYHQGPGQIDELWILDVDGTIAVLDAMYRPDTSAALIDEMRAMVESATFELP